MSTQAQMLILLLFIVVVCSVGAIWQLANIRGYRTRGRRRVLVQPNKARRGDKRNLTSPEKRLYKEAQRMLREKKIPAAARIFEQLGMPREAIQCLEDSKMIHEAASILLRMQRHNRAGVIYARHGMWTDAASCFKTANMHAETAKCYREAGSHALAGTFFEAAGRIDDAAVSYEQAGEFLRAARLLFLNSQRSESLRLYSKAAKGVRDIGALNIRDDELDMLVKFIAAGNDDTGIVNIIVGCNRIPEVLLSLITNNHVAFAARLYTKSNTDIGPALMAETNYGDDSAAKLAEMFLKVSNFDYAGRVLERLEEFEKAAEAFEKAEDYDRASYCYERIGNSAQVRKMKKLARSNPVQQKHGNKGFALANVTSEITSQGTAEHTATNGNDDHTAMIKLPGTQGTLVTEPETPEVRATPIIPPVPEQHTRPAAEVPEAVNAPSIPIPKVETQQSEVPMPPPPSNGNTGNFSLSVLEDDETDEQASSIPAPPGQHPNDLAPPKTIPFTPNATSRASDESHTNIESSPADQVVQLDDGKAAFHRAKFFADLDYRQKNKLWDIGKTQLLKADETILSYNDEPEGIYVILSGNVSCYKYVKDRDSYVDQMGEAESFGELWLLADQPTTVKFVASSATAIRIIDRNSFNDLLDSDGSIARKLYKRFTMRLLKRLLKPQNPNKNQAAS